MPIVGALSYIIFVWFPDLDLQYERRHAEGLYFEEVSAASGDAGGNANEKMRVLKTMLDDELINAEDYEKKKGEILAGM